MSDPKPEMHCYLVSAGWANGVIGATVWIQRREADAIGHAITAAHQNEPKPDGLLTHLFVRELGLDWLRGLVKMLETGQPGEARVVPLHVVPQTAAADNAMLNAIHEGPEPPAA